MDALAFARAEFEAGAKVNLVRQPAMAKLQTVGVMIGLCGGVAAGLCGALLIVAGWMTADASARHWLSTAGTVLLCLTIPLILAGACCLDWIEKNQSLRRSSTAPADDDDEGENNA